jgi:hypothetical protein
MSARTEIAAALSGVAGVNVTSNYRQVTKPGEGFVRLVAMTPEQFGFNAEWEVVIALPQDNKAAEEWIDSNFTSLVGALYRDLHVTRIAPAVLNYEAASTNALVLTGTRDHE